MVFSYTQISQYLRCPRSYRYRYLDGWQEKDTRASMVFGRCFEKALAAKKNLQLKMIRSLPNGHEFVSYVDAIGEIDGQRHLIDWKTTVSRYPEKPEGILSLDPQLLCYSWMSGIREVALVVFVRKHLPEIQYLKTSLTEEQQKTFGQVVEKTIAEIEAGQFLPHTGIRFPLNSCTNCCHLGLCLGNQQLIDAKLIRRPGVSDLDWLDELAE